MEFQGFSNELNIFCNFAGTYCAFLQWSKTPKKGRGILVWGKFYHFFGQYFMLLYFLRTIQCFLMKFCTVVLGITLVVNTLKQCPRSAGGYFWLSWRPILAYVLIFLNICSIFCHEMLFRCSCQNSDYR